MHYRIHQVKEWRQALVVCFFGPIGVSAIFYLYISQEYLRLQVLDENDNQQEEAARLSEIMMVVIWFLVICSIVSVSHLPPKHLRLLISSNSVQIVHGLTILLVKLGIKILHMISEAIECGRQDDDRGDGMRPGPRGPLQGEPWSFVEAVKLIATRTGIKPPPQRIVILVGTEVARGWDNCGSECGCLTSGLKHRVWTWCNPKNQVAGTECCLFDLGEPIGRISCGKVSVVRSCS